MKFVYPLIFLLSFSMQMGAQTNILVTNPEVDIILQGDHDPANYQPTNLITHPDDIVAGLISEVNPDSLKQFLKVLAAFGNRNTGSDTTSSTFGMGAARRWAYAKFESFSQIHENRLITSYLQFDEDICGMGQHRNVMTVLPGLGDKKDEVIIIEGHMDSRCEDNCDINCEAQGMEDNGSGTALVLELARVMGQFAFNRTIVFMVTTGEEQGLHGANAFAEYCDQQGIKVYTVLNNDIVGGIICGETASPPGCPGLNDIDSTNVRIYSAGTNQSIHKGLARFIKLEYEEEVFPVIEVPTVINLMTPQDRSGRGGDHIPFHQRGYAAVRFTSANEHGNGNPSTPEYHDRQHTMEDVLGIDTDNDGVLDSFFVDFNYLSRNAIINGNAAAMSALGPITPVNLTAQDIDVGIQIEFEDPNDYGTYRVGVRTFNTNDFDSLYTVNTTSPLLEGLPTSPYYISVASVDENGIESLFAQEELVLFTTDTEELENPEKGITLLQNNPNPFDEATVIGVQVTRPVDYQRAEIVVHELSGKELVRAPISLNVGMNEYVYDYFAHSYQPGVYAYSLVIDGKLFETKRMVYAY